MKTSIKCVLYALVATAVVAGLVAGSQIEDSGQCPRDSVQCPEKPKDDSVQCPKKQTVPEVIEAEEILEGTKDGSVVVVDVREPEELVETGAIPGSHNIPLGDFERAFSLSPEEFRSTYGFPKPSPSSLAISCRSGVRATTAWEEVVQHGYCDARVYKGSMLDWQAKELPLDTFTISTPPAAA